MEDKVKKVMSEFKAGELKSSSGKKVTSRKQALAIALAMKQKDVQINVQDLHHLVMMYLSPLTGGKASCIVLMFGLPSE